MPSKISESKILSIFQEKHGNRYRYQPFPKSFNLFTTIAIVCPVHGVFQQEIRNHKDGQGCPQCGHRRTSKSLRLSRIEWIQRFESIHGRGKYDYSKVPESLKQDEKIEIYCPEHNISFFQNPDQHWRFKQGCPKCGHAKMIETKKLKIISRRKYVQKARALFGLAFEYSELPLEFSLNDTIIIYCSEHNHFFFCVAQEHLDGKGCQLK